MKKEGRTGGEASGLNHETIVARTARDTLAGVNRFCIRFCIFVGLSPTAFAVGRRLPRTFWPLLTLFALLSNAAPARAAHERLKEGDLVRFGLQTTRGRVTSEALEGRTYAVVFWNASSKKFADTLPDLRRLVKAREDQDFVLIGYNVDDSAAKVQQAMKEGQLTWPQARHDEQDFPFYDLFYRRRSPVPGAFLISDTGQLRWFGPLSRLVEQVEATLPALEGVADPYAAGLAAEAFYRALLQTPRDPAVVLERLRDIPDAAWEQDRRVRLSLRRAARYLTRFNDDALLTLRQAAAADETDAERFERLWALRPERRPAESEDESVPLPPAPPAPDPSAVAGDALEKARAADAAGDLLIAWDHYRAAAEDPHAGAHGPVAQAELAVLESSPDFAQRLAAARRERVASDLYVKALNLLAAGKTLAADTTLRKIRREYHDTDTASAAERALAQLQKDKE